MPGKPILRQCQRLLDEQEIPVDHSKCGIAGGGLGQGFAHAYGGIRVSCWGHAIGRAKIYGAIINQSQLRRRTLAHKWAGGWLRQDGKVGKRPR